MVGAARSRAGRRIFGLNISSDRPLPGFGALSDESAPDLQVRFAERPPVDFVAGGPSTSWYRSSRVLDDGRPALEISRTPDGPFHLQYSDATTFLLAEDGSRLDAWWPPTSTLEDTLCYLGPVLGISLRLRGVLCLHASAVACGDGAFAVAGGAGLGKSTAAAAFARRGLGVLTDDLLALQESSEGFLVEPGLPRVQLWPESVEALWGRPDALPQIVPNWEKRYLDLAAPGYSFCAEPRRLAAIYVLSRRGADVDALRIEKLHGAGAAVALVAQTYANYLLTPEMKAAELCALGRLAGKVELRTVVAPDDRSRIDEVCDAILDDFDRLMR